MVTKMKSMEKIRLAEKIRRQNEIRNEQLERKLLEKDAYRRGYCQATANSTAVANEVTAGFFKKFIDHAGHMFACHVADAAMQSDVPFAVISDAAKRAWDRSMAIGVHHIRHDRSIETRISEDPRDGDLTFEVHVPEFSIGTRIDRREIDIASWGN